MIFGDALAVLGLLLQEIDSCSETFLFFVILFFRLCASVKSLS
jgi:hypothetical protein